MDSEQSRNDEQIALVNQENISEVLNKFDGAITEDNICLEKRKRQPAKTQDIIKDNKIQGKNEDEDDEDYLPDQEHASSGEDEADCEEQVLEDVDLIRAEFVDSPVSTKNILKSKLRDRKIIHSTTNDKFAEESDDKDDSDYVPEEDMHNFKSELNPIIAKQIRAMEEKSAVRSVLGPEIDRKISVESARKDNHFEKPKNNGSRPNSNKRVVIVKEENVRKEAVSRGKIRSGQKMTTKPDTSCTAKSVSTLGTSANFSSKDTTSIKHKDDYFKEVLSNVPKYPKDHDKKENIDTASITKDSAHNTQDICTGSKIVPKESLQKEDESILLQTDNKNMSKSKLKPFFGRRESTDSLPDAVSIPAYKETFWCFCSIL